MKLALSVVPLLVVMAAVPAAAQQPRSISVNQPVTSRLDESDSALENGSRYETWTFQARAGQLLVISMGSDEFDTYVYVGEGTGGAFQEIGNNDDSLGSTDSTFEFRVPRDGTYLIRSSAFEDGAGEYTLVVFDAS